MLWIYVKRGLKAEMMDFKGEIMRKSKKRLECGHSDKLMRVIRNFVYKRSLWIL